MGSHIGKIVLVLLLAAAAGGLWFVAGRARAGTLRDAIREDFAAGHVDGDFLDRLRQLYRTGSAEQRMLARQCLLSLSLPPETRRGAYRAQHVTATLEAAAGTPSQVALQPLTGLYLQPGQVIWGEESGIGQGIYETVVWAQWDLVNLTDQPLVVDRGFFVVYGRGSYRLAANGLGQEPDRATPVLQPGAGFRSASWFNTLSAAPQWLEYNDGQSLVREPIGQTSLHGHYPRDYAQWPASGALQTFPVRTPLSQQVIAGDVIAPYRQRLLPPAPPTPPPATDSAAAQPAADPAAVAP